MVHNLLVFLFAMTGGLTLSGIIANLYRIIAGKPETNSARAAYYMVMVVAGPSVLIDNAGKSWRAKKCSAVAFWLATALTCYWSFIIGLFALNVALSI